MTKEVKNDVTDDDIKAFEEADEAGEVKTGDERTIEDDTEVKEFEEEADESDEEESEESEEDEEEEETEVEDDESDDDKANSSDAEIKEVAGETKRERALRLELTRLRKKNRDRDQKDLLNSDKKVDADSSNEELKELGYDDEQINTLDKAFDIIGKKKGFVRKDQNYASMANDTLGEFIEEHPEYSPDNDKEDIYWGRFNSILKSDYNLKNKTSKQLKSIFNRVDRDVKEELGESTSKGKVNAQKQKIKSVSPGTSTSKKADEVKTVKKTAKKQTVNSGHPGLVFKGFDDDEIEEFTK